MSTEGLQDHDLGSWEKPQRSRRSRLSIYWDIMKTKDKTYKALPSEDELEDKEQHVDDARWVNPRTIVIFSISSILVAALFVALFTVRLSLTSREASCQQSPASCSSPLTRREWRTLRDDEQLSYISAVMCLTKVPSVLTSEASLYDDHALAHMLVGSRSHFVASFFPWHRMFLHIFELNLKTKCGYQGSLPYWDWSLDYEDIASAPVWDNNLGFGGDGDANSPSNFHDGSHCVTSGPFNSTFLHYLDGVANPHCLSRGFFHYETKQQGSLSGFLVQPGLMRELAGQPTYNTFRNFTERVVHNAIHWGVRGDFGQWSSANDPIFYLHHAQLDRLWWIWQNEMPERRFEYYGQGFASSGQAAGLHDQLNSLGLFRSVQASEVMYTQGGFLCYQY